ncbi:MAG TPA: helix-turn-helix transcriptional regulator [Dongiaceae bacterium]|nr:helix-turn-helix transcriptional regulator [Dongiaceae bacterium]
MFPNLKLQIFRTWSHQNKLARAIGMDETILSKIIHGYRDPTAEQRKMLASFLGADEAWLFESFEAVKMQAASDLAAVNKNHTNEDDRT